MNYALKTKKRKKREDASRTPIEPGIKGLQGIYDRGISAVERDRIVAQREISRQQETSAVSEILKTWPKIVEFVGLSEYEAKVYLCLLGLGSAGVRKICTFCDVPRTKVYDTLNRLVDAGLAVEIPIAPKRFVPIPPSDAFDAFVRIIKRRAVDFASLVHALSEAYDDARRSSHLREKVIWYMDDGNEIMRKCKEIVKKSSQTVTILSGNDGIPILFNSTHRVLDELREQGVRVKLQSPVDPKTSFLAKELSYVLEVERLDVDTPVLLIISDEKQFILSKLAKNDEEVFESAVFSDDPTLLSMLSLLLKGQDKERINRISVHN